MKITATELNKRPGLYMNEAIREPVIIEKTGRPAVVMVSYERYQQLEDAYWGELALVSEKTASLTPEESMNFLLSDD